MSHFVQDGNRIVSRGVYDLLDVTPPPGTCTRCGGAGKIAECIDEERYDVMVPCYACRTFCKPCGAWVKKSGHECKGDDHATRETK